MRAFGILVVLVAAMVMWVGISSLSRTTEMSQTLALLGATDGQAFDANDWAFRWRISAALVLGLGLTSFVAGTGLVRRRRWGLVVWASLVTALALLQTTTQVLELPKYAFEETGPLERAATCVTAVASWAAVWRVRPRAGRAA